MDKVISSGNPCALSSAGPKYGLDGITHDYMNLKSFTAMLLLLIALVMVFTGSMLPPALTGVGFVFIAFVLLQYSRK